MLFSGDDGPGATEANAVFTGQRVDSNVFISGFRAAADPGFVRRRGIAAIVKMFADDPRYPGGAARLPGVRYLVLPSEDRPDYDIQPDAVRAVAFIRDAIARNELVLVHCHWGVSRSATAVLLHLMVHRRLPLALALDRLRVVRPIVNPNPGFMAFLRRADAALQRLRVGGEQPFVAPAPISAGHALALQRTALLSGVPPDVALGRYLGRSPLGAPLRECREGGL